MGKQRRSQTDRTFFANIEEQGGPLFYWYYHDRMIHTWTSIDEGWVFDPEKIMTLIYEKWISSFSLLCFFPLHLHIIHPLYTHILATPQMVSKEMLRETLLSLPASDAFRRGTCAWESVYQVEWDLPWAICKWSSSLCYFQRHKSQVKRNILLYVDYLSFKLTRSLLQHFFVYDETFNIFSLSLILWNLCSASFTVRQHHDDITYASMPTTTIIEVLRATKSIHLRFSLIAIRWWEVNYVVIRNSK